MKRSRNSARPLASMALPSRSNSMTSPDVTSAGASDRDIRKRFGLVGWRADMAESVDHAEVGENAAARHDVRDQRGFDAGDCILRGLGMDWRYIQDREWRDRS